MCLTVYRRKEDIPSDKPLIMINDLFFDTETCLKDTERTRLVLSKIDKAEYASELTFISRNKALGKLNKENLSTGTKTLLNILSHPDKCFSVCECGNNALSLLPLITDGAVFWEIPAVAYTGDASCNIMCDGKVYTDFYEFLESV